MDRNGAGRTTRTDGPSSPSTIPIYSTATRPGQQEAPRIVAAGVRQVHSGPRLAGTRPHLRPERPDARGQPAHRGAAHRPSAAPSTPSRSAARRCTSSRRSSGCRPAPPISNFTNSSGSTATCCTTRPGPPAAEIFDSFDLVKRDDNRAAEEVAAAGTVSGVNPVWLALGVFGVVGLVVVGRKLIARAVA